MSDTHYLSRSLRRMLLLLACMALTEWLAGNPFLGTLFFLAVYVVVAALSGSGSDGGFRTVTTYRLFSQMRLFATAALELGMMLMFCRVLMQQGSAAWWQRYLLLAVWLLFLEGVGLLFARYIRMRLAGLALAEFVVGGVVWVLGDVFLLRSSTPLAGILWSVVWECGIVLVSAGLINFALDFEAVGQLADEPLDTEALKASNARLSRRASLVSAGLMMLVLVTWLWGQPLVGPSVRPRLYNTLIKQLPVLLMLVALFFAIKNPLDRRNREKLMLYIGSSTRNERVRQSLLALLGSRMPFGSRLVCWLAMPFFRHRIVGRENLRPGEYPSVFVCNHGFLYGPIVAALYLPAYFRPWIHDRMLREDMAAKEIELSFPWAKRVFGRKAARWIYRTFAHWVVRLLQSFRPIPVVRGASHETASTFDLSLQALDEGDNLLLFPEKPKRLAKDAGADLRNLYTGFAHIGKLHYDATGRRLLFYPIYSDRRRRTFSIGLPVQYDPSLAVRDAKRAVAEELQRRMEDLMAASRK